MEDMDWQTQSYESELNKLGEFLSRDPAGPIQNAEALDGFFAALICCPDLIGPNEYMPVLLNIGSNNKITHFANDQEAGQFSGFVAEHWHRVHQQLNDEEDYVPLVQVDEDGKFHANDWANGFMEGTELRREIWDEFLKNEEVRDFMLPIWTLAYENHENPKMRACKEPLTDQERRELYLASGYCVLEMNKYFSKQRSRYPETFEAFTRSDRKIGRNAPCSCGSGKKFKQCCGRRSILN